MTKTIGGHFGIGGGLKIPTPVSESGNTLGVGGGAFTCVNIRDCFGLNLELQRNYNNGNEYFQPTEETGLLLGLSYRRRALQLNEEHKVTGTSDDGTNIYVGVTGTGQSPSFLLGRDLFYRNWSWKTSERFGFSLAPHARLTTLLADERTQENVPSISVSAGLNLQLHFFDDTVALPAAAPTTTDTLFFLAEQLHGFAGDALLFSALTNPSRELQDYSSQLFGTSESPSSTLEGVPFLLGLTTFGAAQADGNVLRYTLGKSKETLPLSLAVGARAVASFAYGMGDRGISGLNTAGALGIAHLLSLKPGSSKERGRDFLAYRLLLNGATFLAGWLGQESTAGQMFLQGGGQALLASAMSPDPAGTFLVDGTNHLALFEVHSDGSRFFGYRQVHRLAVSNLYIGASLLGQTTPVSIDIVQNGLDAATGRDALVQGASAKLLASGGYEWGMDNFNFQLGARAGLWRGESPLLIPGLGAEANAIASFTDAEKKSGLIVGAGVFVDYAGESLRPGLQIMAGGEF